MINIDRHSHSRAGFRSVLQFTIPALLSSMLVLATNAETLSPLLILPLLWLALYGTRAALIVGLLAAGVSYVLTTDATTDTVLSGLMVLIITPAVCLTVQRLVAKVRFQALQLEELSRTDPLTGAANRRGLQHYLGHELIRAAREGLTVTVSLIDLDHLTKYNESEGREAGDRLLTDSVEAWREELRAGDCIGRYGGEEFAVVLPSCSLDEADGVIERLRKATPASQTCSAGVVEWNGVESAKNLILRAEDAMSEAKQAGGDRAVTRVTIEDPAPTADTQAIHRLLREINQSSW